MAGMRAVVPDLLFHSAHLRRALVKPLLHRNISLPGAGI
jgi:hypothetical protein